MTAGLPLVEVVVHRDGALVTRRGTLVAREGQLLCAALPLLLEPASLRAQVHGPTLRGMKVGWDLEGIHREPIPQVASEWIDAKRALALLEAERDVIGAQRNTLVDLGPSLDPEAPLPAASRLLEWVRLEEGIGRWAAELDERLAGLQRQIIEARGRVELLEHQVGQGSSEAFWRHWQPTRQVVLEVDGEGPAEVELSYRIPGATWSPAYTLDTDGLFRRGQFVMRGLVAQHTGEDWEGVQLHLSTAPSTRRIALPELPALRLGRAQPPPPSPWRPLPDDLEALFPPTLPPPPQSAPDASHRVRAAFAGRAAPPPAPAPADAAPAMALLAAPVSPPEVTAESASAEPPEPPSPQAIRPTDLDYGNLRLMDWTAGPGERGRLRPAGIDGDPAVAALPAPARRRLAAARAEARRRSHQVAKRPLPPHHVLPGPIDDAHYRFRVEGPAHLPSDGRFHNVTVFSEPIELTVRFRAIPRLDSRVYRTVQARMTRSTPLLAGPIDVHIDGSLALSTPWSGTPGRGMLELGLGVEEGIRVARNVRYREESAGMFGKSRRQFTTVEVQVASTLSRPARIEVLERMPVAGQDEVLIEAVQSDPPATPYTGERDGPLLRGGLQQVLQIPPGGERSATLTWSITLGANEELSGGDRRG